MSTIQQLQTAESNAAKLFKEIELRQLIEPGITERELNNKVYDLAFTLFGIKKYWHKRIVRSGKNTLLPYSENPPDLVLEEDDILFLDFGPVFEDWEADFGRTYVIGENPRKKKLTRDIEHAWHAGQSYFLKHQDHITGAELYSYTKALASRYGWVYGNEHCGHLIGNFPHEQIEGEEVINYIHPDNHLKMNTPGKNGTPRHWIYEIHFIDPIKEIGGFFEQLITSY
jgi:Xaa-Pro aminopeptidase